MTVKCSVCRYDKVSPSNLRILCSGLNPMCVSARLPMDVASRNRLTIFGVTKDLLMSGRILMTDCYMSRSKTISSMTMKTAVSFVERMKGRRGGIKSIERHDPYAVRQRIASPLV
jgi:hypothetical protein